LLFLAALVYSPFCEDITRSRPLSRDWTSSYSHLTVMDQRGQVLRSGRIANLQAEIAKFLEGFEAVQAVLETGRSSYTMVDVLEEMGVAVKIAHPNEVKAIARAKIKTDKRDSEVLAHLLRMNMIPEVYRRSVENRKAQRVLRQRAFYVSAMTALKNRVHAFLAQQREEVREEVARETNIFSAKGQQVFLGLDLARGEKRLLEALLKTYRHLETRIEESTALVEKLYEESREAQLVRTIPGFGKFLSVHHRRNFGNWLYVTVFINSQVIFRSSSLAGSFFAWSSYFVRRGTD
jgi:transposase